MILKLANDGQQLSWANQTEDRSILFFVWLKRG